MTGVLLNLQLIRQSRKIVKETPKLFQGSPLGILSSAHHLPLAPEVQARGGNRNVGLLGLLGFSLKGPQYFSQTILKCYKGVLSYELVTV